MAKKLLLILGILCWLSPVLARGIGIGGVRFDQYTFLALFVIGTVAFVGAAVLNELEKKRRR